jgi:hypothetical protein
LRPSPFLPSGWFIFTLTFYKWLAVVAGGWDLNPPQSGEISRKIPSFSVFGLLFGLFCCFGFYFSFEVVEWKSS